MTAHFIEQPRHLCALGGFQSVTAIERALPILHSGPGCYQKLKGTMGMDNAFQGDGYYAGRVIPCTRIGEVEVIYGGEKKLKEVIENTFKVLDADFFVVLSSCVPEIVGDDVGEIVRGFRNEGKAIVYAEAGGFNGTNYVGHEIVLDAIINQFLKPAKNKRKGLVNIWSSVPYQNIFWLGDYRELEKMVAELGLIPNVIFGPGAGLDAINRIPEAEFNLLVSPWVGLRNVKNLEEKFGTPFLHYPVLPVGPTETNNFLRRLGDFAGIDAAKTEAVIKRHEREYDYYIERSFEIYTQTNILPKYFINVADSLYGLGIYKFLVNDLGFVPEKQFITDGVADEYQSLIRSEFKKTAEAFDTEIVFSNDGGWVQQEIKSIKYKEKPLLLGSSWEKILAGDMAASYLSVSVPVNDRLIYNKSYVGYEGALRLLEDIFAVLIANLYSTPSEYFGVKLNYTDAD